MFKLSKLLPLFCYFLPLFFVLPIPVKADVEGTTAEISLFEKIKFGDADTIKQIMQKTDITKLEDAEGNNALMLVAKYNGNPMALRAVLNARFDIFKRNIYGDNALLLSLFNPSTRNFKILISAFTVGGRLAGGEELLHKAIAEKTDISRLQEILDSKVDINSKDEKGRTALSLALEHGSEAETIKFLIDNKADVNIADNLNKTPLMYAAESANRDIIKLLISSNANIKAVDKDGLSVLSYALKNNNPVCFAQLKRDGAVRNAKDYQFIVNNSEASLDFLKTTDEQELIKLINMGADFKVKDAKSRTGLMYAARYNYRPAIISLLSDAGIKINDVDEDGMTAFDYAAENPNAAKIKSELVKLGAFVPTIEVNDNHLNIQSRLFEYAKTGSERDIISAIEAGASPNGTDEYGKTPLMLAAQYNQNPKAVEILLIHGSVVNAKDSNGHTALMLAASSNPNPDVIRKLVVGGAKTFDTYKGQVSLLMLAARSNPSVGVLSLLLSYGQEVNAKDIKGRTALVYAAQKPNMSAVKKLLDVGANIDFLGEGKTKELIKTAVDTSDIDLLSLLLQRGISPELILDKEDTLFTYAIKNGDIDIICLLIKKGANINFTYNGSVPLFAALEHSNLAAVDTLLAEGVDKEVVNASKESPFAVAIKMKIPLQTTERLYNKDKDQVTKALLSNISEVDKETLSFLILKGADLKAKDESGISVLAKAASSNTNPEVLELLVARGLKINSDILQFAVNNSEIKVLDVVLQYRLNLNIKDDDGNTPLMKAAEMGKYEFVRSLLAKGANVRGRNNQGRTALHLASLNPSSPPELLSLLIDEGLNVNLTDYNKDTALSLAVKAGADYDNFKLLVNKGAKIKTTFDDGNTLLMLAARYNEDPDIIRALINAGLSLNSRNKERKTALDYAKENKNPDIKELLIKKGAR